MSFSQTETQYKRKASTSSTRDRLSRRKGGRARKGSKKKHGWIGRKREESDVKSPCRSHCIDFTDKFNQILAKTENIKRLQMGKKKKLSVSKYGQIIQDIIATKMEINSLEPATNKNRNESKELLMEERTNSFDIDIEAIHKLLEKVRDESNDLCQYVQEQEAIIEEQRRDFDHLLECKNQQRTDIEELHCLTTKQGQVITELTDALKDQAVQQQKLKEELLTERKRLQNAEEMRHRSLHKMNVLCSEMEEIRRSNQLEKDTLCRMLKNQNYCNVDSMNMELCDLQNEVKRLNAELCRRSNTGNREQKKSPSPLGIRAQSPREGTLETQYLKKEIEDAMAELLQITKRDREGNVVSNNHHKVLLVERSSGLLSDGSIQLKVNSAKKKESPADSQVILNGVLQANEEASSRESSFGHNVQQKENVTDSEPQSCSWQQKLNDLRERIPSHLFDLNECSARIASSR